MYDLNALADAPAGWTLTIANGIGAGGAIVGSATGPSGEQHAFLLTPTGPPGQVPNFPPSNQFAPAPSSLVLLGLGAVAGGLSRVRRRR